MWQFVTLTTFTAASPISSRSVQTDREAYKNIATENGLYNTTDTIHNGCYAKQIALKLLTFLPAVHILMQTAVILHTLRIVREFGAEQGIRNAWSVRPVRAKLVEVTNVDVDDDDDNNNNNK
jgi:hypothetical protein